MLSQYSYHYGDKDTAFWQGIKTFCSTFCAGNRFFLQKMPYLCRVNNVYYRDIMELLLPCGSEGMKLERITRFIYNRHADLFKADLRYEAIYRSVGYFLWKQSQKRESPFVHNAYGMYAIKSNVAIQLDLFWDMPPEEEEAALLSIEEERVAPKVHQMELF